ncbi:PAS domain-containing sensor histidine kinase [Glycomyces sp. TRM65418]|uniref:sensor histidine kinase n=1 Tax=Glycomyces sp. TRM65418 TaxID=2867006 RepID=UPI001D164AD8|nr:ATP-binding protein [Glycomyces sp. TRM65418]MCC3761759.1 PAS domain-containing sensor histidine kinase [Glycomyces sp. TRM65418]
MTGGTTARLSWPRRPGRSRDFIGARRRRTGFALTLLGLPALVISLVPLRGELSFSSVILIVLTAVMGITLTGGMWPALLAALVGFFGLNYFFTEPHHTFIVAHERQVVALVAFVVLALGGASVVNLSADRARAAARARSEAQVLAEADRLRTALLAAVSHDLRTPLASARAAVGSLRLSGNRFTEAERAELLDSADISLARLGGLVDNLLDMSRLQAGVLGAEPVPIALDEAVPSALDEIGAADVRILVPPALPEVSADPGLLQRILVNLVGNAMRYSPSDRPPLITASEAGESVELRVTDCGPGVPEEDFELMFTPFQRLGDTDNSTGVGLGLALSRGLAEAMGGALTPEPTPAGGLTMVLALPTARQER